ncbi:MAG: NFACT family protein [Clostridia bacterium]|nr:NFACT family protein [Clostridia bacterium]
MALDALFLSHLAVELNSKLALARIDKIHQPERDEIVANLRGTSGSCRLLLSAGANYPRVHLTDKTRENPQTPPMFCMLLRKYFAGGRIVSITQPRLERIIDITVEVNDEMGIASKKTITVELMGRYSNIVLRDAEDRILDSLKRVDFDTSDRHQVLPGLFYELPPAQDKRDARDMSRADILNMLVNDDSEVTIDKWVVSNFLGFSPLTAREVSFRACGNTDVYLCQADLATRERIANAVNEIACGKCTPTILFDENKPVDFSFCDITQYDGHYKKETVSDLSVLLDMFYSKRDGDERIRSKSQTLLKTVKNAYARVERKLWTQKKEIQEALGREKYREWGDIITANIYRLSKGDDKLIAQNFFTDNCEEIEIKLDVRLSPQQNAAKYYKTYHRMKNAELYLNEQIKIGEDELAYLDSVMQMLLQAEGERDIAEIRDELAEAGYLRAQFSKRKVRPLAPREFLSSDGFRIYAGRNNKQNDLLTMKSAMKGDLWFHTQKIPGSHVIVECSGRELPDRTYTEAAMIAAYYSRAKSSSMVPVDYTQVRNVKKPPGSKPGMVTYDKYYTAYVTPDEELINKLRKG